MKVVLFHSLSFPNFVWDKHPDFLCPQMSAVFTVFCHPLEMGSCRNKGNWEIVSQQTALGTCYFLFRGLRWEPDFAASFVTHFSVKESGPTTS